MADQTTVEAVKREAIYADTTFFQNLTESYKLTFRDEAPAFCTIIQILFKV